MTDSPDQNKEEPKSTGDIDLSELGNLSFQPNWGAQKNHSKSFDQDSRPQGGFKKKKGHQQRRSKHTQSRKRNFSDNADGPKGATKPFFKPTVQVKFYPEEAPFQALAKVIRSSCRTYELFEIAHLIIERPERYTIVVTPMNKEGETPKKLFISIPDGLPFESIDDAVNHVLKTHIEKFFDKEITETERPKGSYQVVNKCGITGELLGPPNYHRYQELLKDHYMSNFSNLRYEKFISKIETIRDPEQVNVWLDKMTQTVKYQLKKKEESEETQAFDNLNAVRNYLVNNLKDQIVQEVNTIRLPGKSLEEFPPGNIRRVIQQALEFQKRFPLETANTLRGLLRNMKFNIYKKGNKGISYVCAVKRKFRTPETNLSESLSQLIDFIEKNQNLTALELPKAYLGFSKEEAPKQVSKDDAEANSEKPDAITEDAKLPDNPLTPEQEEKIRRLMFDLRWLVTEGFVVEYGDGRLFASPPQKTTPQKPSKEEAPKPESLLQEAVDSIESTQSEPSSQEIAEEPPQVEFSEEKPSAPEEQSEAKES